MINYIECRNSLAIATITKIKMDTIPNTKANKLCIMDMVKDNNMVTMVIGIWIGSHRYIFRNPLSYHRI
jgi:hypothetical protein